MFEPGGEDEFGGTLREHDYNPPDTSRGPIREWTEREHQEESEEEPRKIEKVADEMLKKKMEEMEQQKLAHPQNKPDKPRDNATGIINTSINLHVD